MTRNHQPASRVSVPGDPDTAWLSDDAPGPSIWAAREVRREPEPDTFLSIAVIVGVALIGVVLLIGWALS
jgi:hypothetical protein